MKIQHIRNATMVIEANDKVILVDPMLNPKGARSTLTLFRFERKRNPTVPLPENFKQTLERVTHCLITHRHPDHIDQEGVKYLVANNIPITCSLRDEKALKGKGLNVVQSLEYGQRVDFLGGKIEGIRGTHGYGFVAKPAGPVMGFYIESPNQPSIYLSSDTIYTDDVDKVLCEYNPFVSVVACGSNQFDIFRPLLMTMADIIRFTRNAPNKVMMNHMEAINNSPTTREELRMKLTDEGLIEKSFIPNDGDWIEIN